MKISIILPHFKQHLPGGYQILIQYARVFAASADVELILPAKASTPAPHGLGMRAWITYFLRQGKRSLQALPVYLQKSWHHHPALRDSGLRLCTPWSLQSHQWPTEKRIYLASWWEDATALAQLMPAGTLVLLCQGYEDWGAHPKLLAECYENPRLQLIAISRWLKQKIQQNHGRELGILSNGISSEDYYATMDAAPRTIGLILRPKEAWKGMDLALEVMRALPEYSFEIACFNPAELPALPANAQVRKCQSKEDMRLFYQSCKLFLNTSLSEGFGLSIAEAMLCQRRVITTPVGCALDLIEQGLHGWVTEHFSAEELVHGIRTLDAQDDALQQKGALSAREQVLPLNPQRQAELLLSELEKWN